MARSAVRAASSASPAQISTKASKAIVLRSARLERYTPARCGDSFIELAAQHANHGKNTMDFR